MLNYRINQWCILKSYIILITFLLLCFTARSQDTKAYQDSIVVEVQKIFSDSLKAQRFYKESTYALRRLNDLNLSRTYIDSAMYYSKVSQFKESEAKCHFLYGLIERVSGNYEVALEHLGENIRYFEKDSTNKAYALFQVGIIHKQLGDYEKSLKTYLEILNIFETKKDSFAIASTYNSIANIYGDMENYDEALLHYKNANDIFINKGNKRNQSQTYRNMAEIYLRKGDSVQSRTYAEKALRIAQETKEDFEIGSTHFILARTYLSSKPNQALSEYLKAKSILEKTRFSSTLINLYNDLGDYYKQQKNIPEALLYYNKALGSLKTDYGLSVQNTYEGLSNSYSVLGDYKKAYNFQSKYIQVKDSLLNQENLKSINLLQKQFETEKKNKALITQQLELQKQENEIQKKSNEMTLLYGILSFVFVLSILIWLSFQHKQKQKDQQLLSVKREYQIKSLEALIEGEEKERLRVAKELHDGVNGDLSAIKFKLSSLLEMNNSVIKEAITMIDDSCKQVRAISHNLVPPSLENFSLVEATEAYCNNMEAKDSISIIFQSIGDPFAISKKAEINIFRIIQELITNSLRHANATEISVQISCRDNQLQITVEDDGKGFDVDHVEQGIGLSNISSRVEYLNATVDFLSNAKGTSYTFEMDINQL